MSRKGYLKALEGGNSVPRPNRFGEADKVKYFAVLSLNPKFCNLRVMHTLIFIENILFYGFFWPVMNHSMRGPGLPVRGPASLQEARPPFERPGLPLRGPASLEQAWPPC